MERPLHGSWPRRRNSDAKMFWKHSAIWDMPAVAVGRPPERLWDAVRFAVSRAARSAWRNRADGMPPLLRRTLLLHYVCERNHRPVEHGDLEFDLSRATWLRQHAGPTHPEDGGMFSGVILEKEIENPRRA